MSPSNPTVKVTFIGTATAILHINDINILTDPFFAPVGTVWDREIIVLKNTVGAAIQPKDLPPIDFVLLSHEDHPDNLDEVGRQLLDGLRVLTTNDGAKNLGEREGVKGFAPGDATSLTVGGHTFDIVATPAKHAPVGECIGFLLTSKELGSTNGRPNAIWFSGDTVYTEEISAILQKYHVKLALINLGSAAMPISDPPLQITMDGQQAVRFVKEAGIEAVVPMHFEGWGHFTEGREALTKVFKEEGIEQKVIWVNPGEKKSIF